MRTPVLALWFFIAFRRFPLYSLSCGAFSACGAIVALGFLFLLGGSPPMAPLFLGVRVGFPSLQIEGAA